MRAFGAPPPAVRAVVVVAATSLFMVLVAWATLIGPDEVFTGPGRVPHTLTPTTQSCTPAPTEGATASEDTGTGEADSVPECEAPDTSLQDARDLVRRAEPPLWIKILVWTFEFLLLAAILALAVFAIVQARDLVRRRTRFAGERESVDFATLDEPARLVEAITRDAAQQDQLLMEGEPRNAIVAAWLRFEVQGADAGMPRQEWETSSEYAIRILDVVAADSGAVNRLAGVYREARFSEHSITEDHRAAAVEALAAIRRSLAVRA